MTQIGLCAGGGARGSAARVWGESRGGSPAARGAGAIAGCGAVDAAGGGVWGAAAKVWGLVRQGQEGVGPPG
eukprot:1748629-Lingulodinium_polyedra.AAC.1